MAQKQIHIKQRFKTRPIVLYAEFTDLSEKDFENMKQIQRLVTDELEAKFVRALDLAIDRYCETGRVPTAEEVSEQVDNLMTIKERKDGE